MRSRSITSFKLLRNSSTQKIPTPLNRYVFVHNSLVYDFFLFLSKNGCHFNLSIHLLIICMVSDTFHIDGILGGLHIFQHCMFDGVPYTHIHSGFPFVHKFHIIHIRLLVTYIFLLLGITWGMQINTNQECTTELNEYNNRAPENMMELLVSYAVQCWLSNGDAVISCACWKFESHKHNNQFIVFMVSICENWKLTSSIRCPRKCPYRSNSSTTIIENSGKLPWINVILHYSRKFNLDAMEFEGLHGTIFK